MQDKVRRSRAGPPGRQPAIEPRMWLRHGYRVAICAQYEGLGRPSLTLVKIKDIREKDETDNDETRNANGK